MPEILFVTWDGGGAVPPALMIAGELARRRHEVRFLGHPAQAPSIAGAGCEFRAYPTARPFDATAPGGLADQLHVFGDRDIGHDLLAEVASRPTDLVVVDCMLAGALAVAAGAGLRFAVLEHTFDDYVRRRLLRGPVGLSHLARGLRPFHSLAAAGATLVTALPSLDPGSRRRGAASLTYVGPLVASSPPVRHEPTVLVSLSTYGYPGLTATLQRVVDAARATSARVVVTTGPAVDPSALRAGPGVAVHRYLPHREVMPAASVVVGHGGHGTTMQALAHGLPAVLLPLSPFADQHLVASAVERKGAGVVLGRRAPVERITAAIESMLGDGPHRVAATRLATEIAAMPGVAGAADRLEELVRAPRPPAAARGRGRRAARP